MLKNECFLALKTLKMWYTKGVFFFVLFIMTPQTRSNFPYEGVASGMSDESPIPQTQTNICSYPSNLQRYVMSSVEQTKVVINDVDPSDVEYLLSYLYTGVLDSCVDADAVALLTIARSNSPFKIL